MDAKKTNILNMLRKGSESARTLAKNLMTDEPMLATYLACLATTSQAAADIIEQQDKEIATLKSQLAAATKGPAVH